MARLPPSSGGDPDFVEFGIPVVDGRLDDADLTFPATAEELDAALGDEVIPYDASGNAVAFSVALERVDRDSFESERELLELLHPVFEGFLERCGDGLIDRLYDVLPF